MNLKSLPYILLALVVALLLDGCKHTPEGVIPSEEMAQLMADIYMGEGVVDINSRSFHTDSDRLVLKQSIYELHGVDQKQVDTSFVWYGHHIEEYIKVLERTEEILKDRQHNLAVTSSKQLSLSGDSVNLWSGAERVTVNRGYPRRFITFAIPADTTWHPGDTYTLRYKLVNGQRPVDARVSVDYEDGITRVYFGKGKSQGHTELKFKIDKNMTPTRLYGAIDVDARPGEHFHIDSIALIRTRRPEFDHFYSPPGLEIRWKGKKTIDTDSVSNIENRVEASSENERDSHGNSPAKQAPAIIDIPPATIGPQAVRTQSVRR